MIIKNYTTLKMINYIIKNKNGTQKNCKSKFEKPDSSLHCTSRQKLFVPSVIWASWELIGVWGKQQQQQLLLDPWVVVSGKGSNSRSLDMAHLQF